MQATRQRSMLVKGIYSPWSSQSRFDKKIYIVRYGHKMSSKEEDSELFFHWLKLHMKAGAEWKHKNRTYPQKMQAFML
ncbi:hypothetical protein T12_16805 [Trichinella patagoniensis]|uniref:Uncharacterized protein n=1 Tax=Trichinella patagoniensis TaxID=990121 RepID=A0A0V0ZXA9_9BILA|nr:hypothetical protein T12_16805 [Trichinella patagoniensis]